MTHDLVVYADLLFHYFLKSSILLLFSIGEIEVRVFFPVDLGHTRSSRASATRNALTLLIPVCRQKSLNVIIKYLLRSQQVVTISLTVRPLQLICFAACHNVTPRGLNTVVCDQFKLEELHDAHCRHVEECWTEHGPRVRCRLL